MRTSAIALLVLGGCASLAAAQTNPPVNNPKINPDWSYQAKTGPVFWSRISPEYKACSKGREQSPVDIRDARLDKALKPLQFHFLAGPVTLINTGRTVRAQVKPGSYIIANGTRYDLLYYEFHSPSEHTVNRHLSDMELDMMFRSAEGKQANLAVLLAERDGFPNATLATLWSHLPARAGQTEKVTDMVNPGGLLPADRGYWTYMGSELNPPCTEGLQWYVLEQAVSISRSQFNGFTAMYDRNTRPTQELHGRKIEANE